MSAEAAALEARGEAARRRTAEEKSSAVAAAVARPATIAVDILFAN